MGQEDLPQTAQPNRAATTCSLLLRCRLHHLLLPLQQVRRSRISSKTLATRTMSFYSRPPRDARPPSKRDARWMGRTPNCLSGILGSDAARTVPLGRRKTRKKWRVAEVRRQQQPTAPTTIPTTTIRTSSCRLAGQLMPKRRTGSRSC